MTIFQSESIPPNPSMKLGEQCLEELQALLYRYCMSVAGCPWDAQDLVQDTWLKVLGIFQSRTHANPEALLLRTAKNIWIDRMRRHRVYRRILDEELVQIEEAQAECMDSKLHMEAVFQQLLRQLSPTQCTVFILREGFGFSVAETAVLLKCTEGAVKAALHRARRALHSAQLEEESSWALITEEEKVDEQLLQSLAAAFLAGDVEDVIRLIQSNCQSVMAIGTLLPQQHRLDSGSVERFDGYFRGMYTEAVLAA